MRFRASTVLAVIFMAGCAPVVDPQQSPGGNTLPGAEEVVREQYSGVAERQRLVISDTQSWRDLWNAAHRLVVPVPPVPELDFGASVVLVATMGTRSSGGHSIEMDVRAGSGGDVEAVVVERSPGANCITTAALTAPIVAVRIPRPAASVRFVERRETLDC